MDTLKTAVVVVLLLAILYCVYVFLNKSDPGPLPQEMAWHANHVDDPMEIEMDFGQQSESGELDMSMQAASSLDSPAGGPMSDGASSQWGSADTAPTGVPETPEWAKSAEMPAESMSFPTGSEAVTAPSLLSDAGATEPPGSSTPLAYSESKLGSSSVSEQPAAQESRGGSGADGMPDKPAAGIGSYYGTSIPPETSAVQGLNESAPSPANTGESIAKPAFSRFDSIMRTATDQIQAEQWHSALKTLTAFYSSPDLDVDQRKRLLNRLDSLAGQVIYSTEHLVEPAHRVQRGETVDSISSQYQMPWQLLANINGITDVKAVLTPGTSLKVLRGPFRAEVDLRHNELTLFVGDLYAGRFPVSIGSDPPPQPGEYRINDKQTGQTYYAADGRTFPAGAPSNPYGQVWLDLGGDVCIHGSSLERQADAGLGCISLSPTDANDVYGILSRGSAITVLR